MFACGPESRQCACTSCPGKVGSLRQSSCHSCRTSEWPVVSLNIRTSALRGLAAASCVFVLQPPEYDATGYPCTSPVWSTYSAMLPRRASSQSLNHSCRSHSSGSRDIKNQGVALSSMAEAWCISIFQAPEYDVTGLSVSCHLWFTHVPKLDSSLLH